VQLPDTHRDRETCDRCQGRTKRSALPRPFCSRLSGHWHSKGDDNDVQGTEYCIGFPRTITRAEDAITHQRTTPGSHERIGIFRIFRRDAGCRAIYTAHVTSAIDQICATLREHRRGSEPRAPRPLPLVHHRPRASTHPALQMSPVIDRRPDRSADEAGIFRCQGSEYGAERSAAVRSEYRSTRTQSVKLGFLDLGLATEDQQSERIGQ
jgi:hypothetical protein